MKGKNPYENDPEIRKFIESLTGLDGLSAELVKKLANNPKFSPIDPDVELVHLLLKDWFKMISPNMKISKERQDFCVSVFKELKKTRISIKWYEYIEAMVSWFRISTTDTMTSDMAIFLFGYCWKEMSDKDNEPPES